MKSVFHYRIYKCGVTIARLLYIILMIIPVITKYP
ncbi:hypothetical protein ABIC22_004038 [Paenibacillus sp. PvP094]